MTVALVVTIAAGLLIAAADTVYRLRKGHARQLVKDLVWLAIVDVSIATSFAFLFDTQQMVITDKLTITFTPALAFPIVVFVKILIGFWVYHMVFCIAHSERITETGLKIFGVEMTNKMNLDIDQTTESYETLAWQLDQADTLLTSFINYYIQYFDYQVGGAVHKPSAIRNALRSILTRVYHEAFGEGVCSIYVLQLSEEGLAVLDDNLRSMVELNDKGDPNRLGVFANIGISYHRFEDPDYDTLILIRAPEDYFLPRAEISAASMFFISAVKTVEYIPAGADVDSEE